MQRLSLALLVLAAVTFADKKKPDFPPWSEVGKEMKTTEDGSHNR